MWNFLEVEKNAEGSYLAILSPIDEKGEFSKGGYRIAGPKAWGGSTAICSLKVTDNDLFQYIKYYARDVYNRIKEDDQD